MIQIKCDRCNHVYWKPTTSGSLTMFIRDLSEEASLQLLRRATLARVACSHQNQPYVAPMSVTYDQNWLYGFSTVGQKINWMRANPHI